VAPDLGEGRVRILVPVNRKLRQDQEDFDAFRARLDEVCEDFETEIEGGERQGPFEFYYFDVQVGDADELANRLVESSGPQGWGSVKDTTDKALGDR